MADINRINLGPEAIDGIMYSGHTVPCAAPNMVFGSLVPKSTSGWGTEAAAGEWEINDDWEVEFVSKRKMLIKKFKIDTWGIRRKWSSDTKSNYTGNSVKVTGITYVHENVIKANADDLEEVTGFVPAYTNTWGTVWVPGKYSYPTHTSYVSGLVVCGCGAYTEAWNKYGDASFQFNTRGTVANSNRDHTINDGIIPKGMSHADSQGICIGLFGGVQNATTYMDNANGAYRIYDISDHPIEVDLDVEDLSLPMDYSTAECWDVYLEGDQLYHKDKTVENCLKKYNYLQEDTGIFTGWNNDKLNETTSTVSISNYGEGTGEVIVPVPVDFEEFMSQTNPYPKFNVKASNSEFWDAVKAHAETNGFYMIIIVASQSEKGLFSNSNISGTLNLKLLNLGTLALDNAFDGTSIEELNITYAAGDGTRITSLHNAFIRMPSLKTITTTRRFGFVDISGAFEFDGSLVTLPGTLFDYTTKGSAEKITRNGLTVYVSNTNCCYAFEYCGKLVSIGDYDEDGVRDNNDLVTCGGITQMFNECYALEYIGPVLDLAYIRPIESNKAFLGCRKLSDVRLKNLNHGDWRLDGSAYSNGTIIGNIPALDAESVVYLFENLSDLAGRGELPEYDETNDVAIASYPEVGSAGLYCPEEWSDKITDDMVTAANTKGWTVYVGGTEKTVTTE